MTTEGNCGSISWCEPVHILQPILGAHHIPLLGDTRQRCVSLSPKTDAHAQGHILFRTLKPSTGEGTTSKPWGSPRVEHGANRKGHHSTQHECTSHTAWKESDTNQLTGRFHSENSQDQPNEPVVLAMRTGVTLGRGETEEYEGLLSIDPTGTVSLLKFTSLN